MKLTFLGSGAAFTMDNRQSNMLLEDDRGHRLLIDCGSDIRHSLQQVGIDYKGITDVYISHLHADHVGGLEWLAFCSYFDPACPQPRLYINEALEAKLWHDTLAGGLSSIEGKVATLDTYFKVIRIPVKDGAFKWESHTLQTVQTVHVMSGFVIVPSFGLLFNIGDEVIFLTTDTQHNPEQIQEFYDMATIIFQDCETSPFKSGVHAHYKELVTLNDETRAKMWLYHYQDGELPPSDDDGFRGFVEKHQAFEF